MTIEEELQALRDRLTHQEDRQAILDCIQREARGRDRQHTAMISSCWWPEGLDEHGAFVSGADVYPERANAGHRANFHMTSHNITNHHCEIEGTTAICESYVIGGLHWLEGSKTTLALGRYIDQLEKRDGQWRILLRRCTIEMTADADDSWVYSANVKGFLKGLWTDQDPSRLRPVVPGAEGERW